MDNNNNKLDKLAKLEAKILTRRSTMDLISNDKSISDNYSTSSISTSRLKLNNKRNSLSCSLNDLVTKLKNTSTSNLTNNVLNTQLTSSSRAASLTSVSFFVLFYF